MNDKKDIARNEDIRWDDLASFLAVARTGGLSAAARQTGSSAPTLGRQMRALERATGRELFVRRTHGYDLTEAGQVMMRELEGIAGRIARVTAPASDDTLPLVKVSAGTWTTLALVRHINQIAGDPADVRLRFVSSEAVLSINRREVAIGVRNHRPTELGLAGRRVGRVQFAIYAASGAPSAWICVQADTPSARWVLSQTGQPVAHEVSHPRIALDMALASAGQIVLPTFIGDDEPGLQQLGPPIETLTSDQWLVTHDDDRNLPEVRRTFDRFAAFLS